MHLPRLESNFYACVCVCVSNQIEVKQDETHF